MKVLYISCHSILEYDELRILEDLGIDYFSLGSYVVPSNPADPIRPPLKSHPETWVVGNAPPRDDIPQEFINQFDTIIVMHVPEWITKNWDKFRGKRVIWRTIGQSTPAIEAVMAQYATRGLEIVRYSPREANLEPTAGCTKIIRFYKDPNEFGGWIGAGNEVITFAQDMKHRGEFCNYDAFVEMARGFNTKIYGPKNELSGELNGGLLAYSEMKQKMRDARVYVYTGTQPASYTLGFIEAMMTGIPIVAIGSGLATSLNTQNKIHANLYEIPDIITNAVNGFVTDDIQTARKYIQALLDDPALAKRIGTMGRERAISLFGKDTIQLQWKELLQS